MAFYSPVSRFFFFSFDLALFTWVLLDPIFILFRFHFPHFFLLLFSDNTGKSLVPLKLWEKWKRMSSFSSDLFYSPVGQLCCVPTRFIKEGGARQSVSKNRKKVRTLPPPQPPLLLFQFRILSFNFRQLLFHSTFNPTTCTSTTRQLLFPIFLFI